MDLPRGAFAPVPTPLDSQGRFDAAALHRHMGWLTAEGLDGVLILGTNGEFPSLSQDERIAVASAAGDAGEAPRAGAAKLQRILCIGSTALPETLQLARLGAELGYDALLCPPPYYFRAAPLEGLAAFFRTVLDAARVPVLLYHFPRIIGVPISDDLLDAIGPHEMLHGVKDSSGDPADMKRLLPRFVAGAYFVGSDRLVQSCVEAGGRGSITAAASVAPALVKAVQEMEAPQEKLDRVRTLLEEFGLGAAVKSILRDHGFGDYAARPPMLPLALQRERELLRQLPSVLE